MSRRPCDRISRLQKRPVLLCQSVIFGQMRDPLINPQVGQHVQTRNDHPRRNQTRALQVQILPAATIDARLHFGQNLFSKSFQRCCRVDPLQRSRASAKYRQTARIFDLSKLFGMRKCVVTSSTLQATCLGRSAGLPVPLLSGMSSSSLLGSSFSPCFKPLIPSFETHSRDGPFAVKGKAVASHKPAAL